MTEPSTPADPPDNTPAETSNTSSDNRMTWVDTLGRVIERWVPDALTTAIALMVVLIVLSLIISKTQTIVELNVGSQTDTAQSAMEGHEDIEDIEVADGKLLVTLSEGVSDGRFVNRLLEENGIAIDSADTSSRSRFLQTLDAYYQGLWRFLSFTMQMTLILVLSLIVTASPLFKQAVVRISTIPRSRFQVVALSALCVGVLSYLNWGLSLALGPVIAIHFCREAERNGIEVDFLFLLAILAGAGSIWQFGLSASAPLIMATPDQQIVQDMDVMPLRTTIWAPAAIVHVTTFMAATVLAGCWLMPKRVRPISEFADSMKVADMVGTAAEAVRKSGIPMTPAKRLEHSSLVLLPLVIMLIGWLYAHFVVKQLSVDINAVNTTLLLLSLVLHRNVANFQEALRGAIKLSWPVVVLYHLYAGVAGLIQFTPVGEFLVSAIAPISTQYTFPLLIAIISSVVAIFIPTSGGQWAIQGSVTTSAAEAVGVSAQRGLLALSVGDHMGNLLTPFWAVVGANIARVDFRLLFGYRLIFAGIWFVIGVLCFTFLPC